MIFGEYVIPRGPACRDVLRTINGMIASEHTYNDDPNLYRCFTIHSYREWALNELKHKIEDAMLTAEFSLTDDPNPLEIAESYACELWYCRSIAHSAKADEQESMFTYALAAIEELLSKFDDSL